MQSFNFEDSYKEFFHTKIFMIIFTKHINILVVDHQVILINESDC